MIHTACPAAAFAPRMYTPLLFTRAFASYPLSVMLRYLGCKPQSHDNFSTSMCVVCTRRRCPAGCCKAQPRRCVPHPKRLDRKLATASVLSAWRLTRLVLVVPSWLLVTLLLVLVLGEAAGGAAAGSDTDTVAGCLSSSLLRHATTICGRVLLVACGLQGEAVCS